MARPSKQESQDRVGKIVDAAADLFAKKGVRGTTIGEIAAKCGIRAPSVLHYFKTKEGLFLAVVRDRVHKHFLQEFRLEDLNTRQPPAKILEAGLRAGVAAWKREPKLIAAAFTELIHPDGIGREAMKELLVPLLDQFVGAAQTLLPKKKATNIPIREISLMFVFSLAGRFATLEDEPNLWGPESDIYSTMKLILNAVSGPAVKS